MAITIALCAIVIFLFIPNYNFGFDLIGSKEASFREVKLAGEWIKANSNPEDIVITASMPQNSYYSERATYNFYLVLAIPTENLLSRKMRKLFGKPERVPDHITTLNEIVQIMKDEKLEIIRKLNYFAITHLYLFKFITMN